MQLNMFEPTPEPYRPPVKTLVAEEPESKIKLRSSQPLAISLAREKIAQKFRRGIIAAPCGFGKSVVACAFIEAAIKKGSKVWFVVDRQNLVNQMSGHLDNFGIPHAVMMSGHWRWDPENRVQVVSIQTVEKRGWDTDIGLMVVDEAHANLRKSFLQFIKDSPKTVVIGITATPFHQAIGSAYEYVVNPTTTNKQIEEGFLVPLRIFQCVEADMKGAKTSGGEWTDEEVRNRGRKIIGDIVTTWQEKTMEFFGKPVKTIVFPSTIAHGQEIADQFAAAGYNFKVVSCRDSTADKEAIIADFKRPDTQYHGLISCGVLTRGFDVTDIQIGIMARPFRKAFSEFIQEIGRVQRAHTWADGAKKECLAAGSKILTQRGLVDIDKITLNDLVWDGNSFVSHSGAISKGVQNVITYAGLTATPNHRVKTAQGWRTFRECAAEQIPIIKTGFGRHPIRECDGMFSRSMLEGEEMESKTPSLLPMCYMWPRILDFIRQSVPWKNKRMPGLQPAREIPEVVVSEGQQRTTEMHKSQQQALSRLWRTWHTVQFRFRIRCLRVDKGQFRDTRPNKKYPDRQNKQQRALRTGKYKVVHTISKLFSYSKTKISAFISQVQRGTPRREICGFHFTKPATFGNDHRTDTSAMGETIQETQREVWDILDCGPFHCFTANGLLVHNCGVLLDHAGNVARFLPEMLDLFENGVSSLAEPADAKPPRKEPTKKEKKDMFCPKCHRLWDFQGDTCPCGFKRKKVSTQEVVAGTMQEVFLGKIKMAASQRDLWNQIVNHCRNTGKPETAEKRAYWAFKSMAGMNPPSQWQTEFYAVPPQSVSRAVKNEFTRQRLAYLKGREKR